MRPQHLKAMSGSFPPMVFPSHGFVLFHVSVQDVERDTKKAGLRESTRSGKISSRRSGNWSPLVRGKRPGRLIPRRFVKSRTGPDFFRAQCAIVRGHTAMTSPTAPRTADDRALRAACGDGAATLAMTTDANLPGLAGFSRRRRARAVAGFILLARGTSHNGQQNADRLFPPGRDSRRRHPR